MGRVAKNVVLALLSLVVALLAAELAARAFVGPVRPRNLTRVPEEIRRPAPFPGVPFLLAPHAEVVQSYGSDPRGTLGPDAAVTYRTNALGWRGPDQRLEKDPGAFRILALGDSVTFGTGVREEDGFVGRLRRALQTGAPGRYQVWNLGVMGFNTDHEVSLLQHLGLDLDPDLALIVYVLNDAETTLPESLRKALALDSPEPGMQRPSGSVLVDHLLRRLQNRRLQERSVRLTRTAYRDDAPGWIQVQAALRRAAALARSHDFRLALVVFPLLTDLDGDYPFAEAHAAVAAAAARLEIPVLDLLETFRGRDARSLWVHPSDQHPNAEAHALAADALLAFLRERRLLGD